MKTTCIRVLNSWTRHELCAKRKYNLEWTDAFKGPQGVDTFRVPTGTGKPVKMRQLFPVREKSGNF